MKALPLVTKKYLSWPGPERRFCLHVDDGARKLNTATPTHCYGGSKPRATASKRTRPMFPEVDTAHGLAILHNDEHSAPNPDSFSFTYLVRGRLKHACCYRDQKNSSPSGARRLPESSGCLRLAHKNVLGAFQVLYFLQESKYVPRYNTMATVTQDSCRLKPVKVKLLFGFTCHLQTTV